jgi:AcrR family transcriptional regulator
VVLVTEKETAQRRSDAQHDCQRLIKVAKSAFTDGEVETRLDEIARRAGFGVGTLYRHFPTRDALIEAVLRKGSDCFHSCAGFWTAAARARV